jgi:Sulfotransferase domain
MIVCKWLLLLATSLFIGQVKAEAHKIQIVMTVPRTVSTAFERSMMARGDHKIFHEPWNSEYLYRIGKLKKAPPAEIVEAGGYDGIKEMLYRYAEQTPVCVKDMIWAVSDQMIDDEALLSDSNVVITLLIRDPALSIESFFLKMSETVPLDIALEETRHIFRYDSLVLLVEKYREIRGKWPILIEAEELCARPQAIMECFCKQAGIDYMPGTLAWEKGMQAEWKHLERWHTDAAESESFFTPKREAKNRFSAVPELYIPLLEILYQEQKPYYDKLKKMKI